MPRPTDTTPHGLLVLLRNERRAPTPDTPMDKTRGWAEYSLCDKKSSPQETLVSTNRAFSSAEAARRFPTAHPVVERVHSRICTTNFIRLSCLRVTACFGVLR